MDEERYGQLLKQARPRIIQTPEEHERTLGLAEELMEKDEGLSEEEEQLLALLVLLIEAFEMHFSDEEGDDHEPGEPPLPHHTLQRLMQSQGLELPDISDVFGNPHIAREVLEGRRPISRGQAKALGKLFRVPPKLFHPG